MLNRSDAKVGLKAEDVEAALKQSIAANIPNSLTVPASINRGRADRARRAAQPGVPRAS